MTRWTARLAPLALVLTAACSHPVKGITRAPDDSPPVRELSIDRGTVRAMLGAHRAQQIERLHTYADLGQFPHNDTTAPSLHMFRDDGFRLCAVANLVHQDGRDDLVAATVRDRNDLAIADVTDGPMLDWVLTSGLTQEELARVQLPLPPLRAMPQPGAMPVKVARIDPVGAVPEARMKEIVRAHIAQVEAELRAQTEQKLEVVVDRYLAASAKTI